MNRRFAVQLVGIACVLTALALLGIPAVFAVPPTHDDFDHAVVVNSLPFIDALDTREATVAEDDPFPFCGGRAATVWYALTPTENMRVDINTSGSSYPTSISVYSGPRGSLSQWVCGGSQVNFTAQVGITYYLMIGSLSGGYPGPGESAGGDLAISISQVPAPTNDDFDDAIEIINLPFSDSNLNTRGATTATDDPIPTCAPQTREATVWYEFTATQTQGIEVNTFGTTYGTSLAVYTGMRGALTEVTCGSFQVVFAAALGQTYYLMVGSDANRGGTLFLTAQSIELPPNDNSDGAITIPSLPFTDNRDTRAATVEDGDPFPSCGGRGFTIWYVFTPVETGRVEFDTLGSNYSASLAVFTGSPGAFSEVACNSFGPVRFTAVGGTTYYLMIGSFSSVGGSLVLNGQELTPPANDDIGNAETIPALPFSTSADTRGATTDPNDPVPSCTGENGREASVWYTFTPTDDQRIEVGVSSDYPASVTAFSGLPDTLTEVACGFPFSGFSFTALGGQTYYLLVGGASGGNLLLSVQGFPPPINDGFAHALEIRDLPFTDNRDTRGATLAPDDPFASCRYFQASTVWYKFAPTETQRVEFNTFGSDYGSSLAVFTGTPAALTEVACNSGTGHIRFTATGGTTYYLVIESFSIGGGQLVFNGQSFAPPPNDNIGDAEAIPTATFVVNADTRGATTNHADPIPSCSGENGRELSVWYKFVATETLRIDISPSVGFDYPVTLTAFSGSPQGLTEVACGVPYTGISFGARAGQTYFLMMGGAPGGNVTLFLQSGPLAANDDFRNATRITALPFSETVDLTGTSLEASEPAPSCAAPTQSVWYKFTPTTTQSLIASGGFPPFPVTIAVYTGQSLNRLTEIACRTTFSGGGATFRAQKGKTYYFQVQTAGMLGSGGVVQFSLDVAPPPIANFGFSPGDPSTFDTIQFNDFSEDPTGLGIQSRIWSFGDQKFGYGCCPTHRYSSDGDYLVKLTVITPDGRRASTSQMVSVRTHDVVIVRMHTPESARAGQTRQITIDVRNTRYPETVEFQMLKLVLGTTDVYEVVGTLTTLVPVRSGLRTSQFGFSYTFTNEDASIGTVKFKIVALLLGFRDARPGDNEIMASPIRVTR